MPWTQVREYRTKWQKVENPGAGIKTSSWPMCMKRYPVHCLS